jgi:Leu/Phe-tRNA-protein transferase
MEFSVEKNMFSKSTDAIKLALWFLVEKLQLNYRCIDAGVNSQSNQSLNSMIAG